MNQGIVSQGMTSQSGGTGEDRVEWGKCYEKKRSSSSPLCILTAAIQFQVGLGTFLYQKEPCDRTLHHIAGMAQRKKARLILR